MEQDTTPRRRQHEHAQQSLAGVAACWALAGFGIGIGIGFGIGFGFGFGIGMQTRTNVPNCILCPTPLSWLVVPALLICKPRRVSRDAAPVLIKPPLRRLNDKRFSRPHHQAARPRFHSFTQPPSAPPSLL
ncbi:uncharacterized protein UV8b_08025 [Ustilaginoidea virens]|uniref:Uncharacterized protein n=1 Tax=Ustilaginoidea virens TaxID=1159556 RepID=A0A8E5HY73_USTVR|nr:uncharacterized protein UV8b_08025 [Ustilaginoidea virens]QUC23784.1 hypothetical protein UV8b_08025 [Ustilaginoidea virens]